MGMIKHFEDEEGHTPISFVNVLLEKHKKSRARLKQLIARYRTAKPDEASKILVDIHKLIDKLT